MSFDEWKAFANRVDGIADRIQRMKLDRIRAEAPRHGLSADGCCLHNAAIDDNLTGWCHRNPARLKAAKRLNKEWNDFTHYQLARNIIRRAWQKTARG